ncbi:hypothetical protein N8381_06100 [Oceanospirillaceae bacterium]|nr:hypothetical protein [Oceanospirillaceae bacterium]
MNKSTTPTTITGTAADGYLRGAKVCLDVNENGVCEDAEPQDTTIAGGVYVITVAPGIDIDKPLLVEVSAQTVDEDDGELVGKPYVMKAPAGKHQFVSPITTLVQQKIENNPALSAADAETKVKTALSMVDHAEVSLFDDYVAKHNSDETSANKEKYTDLHKTARVIAALIAEQAEALEKALIEAEGASTGNKKESFALIMDSINKHLAQITAQISVDEETLAKDFDVKTLKEQLDIQLDTKDISAQIAQKKAAAKREKITSAELEKLTSILLRIRSYTPEDSEETLLSSIDYKSLSLTPKELRLNKDYDYKDGKWSEDSHLDEGLTYVYESATWEEITESTYQTYLITSAENGQFEADNGLEKVRYSFSQDDVSDQKITDIMPEYAKLFSSRSIGDVLFPANSAMYKYDVVNLKESLTIYHQEVHGEDDSCGGTAIATLGGNCNVVDGSVANPHVKSLDALLVAEGVSATTGHIFDEHVVNDVRFQLSGSVGDVSGTVKYFKITEGQVTLPPLASATPGTWEIKTYGDKRALLVRHPGVLNEIVVDTHHLVSAYIQDGGFVRHSHYFPANSYQEVSTLNTVAAQAILNQLGIFTLPSAP